MWSSKRGSGSRSGGGSDPERERRVCSDSARKRGARRWTNRDMSPSASFRWSETKKYDRRRASFSSRRCSYAGSSSSSGSGLLPVKREWSEDEEESDEFDFVPVKEEPEEPTPLGRRKVVRPEDYIADVDAVAAAIAERSVREEVECRRRGARRPRVAAGGHRQPRRLGEVRGVAPHPRGAEGELHRPLQLRRGRSSVLLLHGVVNLSRPRHRQIRPPLVPVLT
ncbi:CDPK-related protein kinase [Hordeum vulgare]|nr:CDPK-related protein kinase [Hordeum vulgare]